jgi:hypothetical protein
MLLGVFFFLAAVMYSSVGHAGASAYLAVMALFGTAQSEMKPTALTLNVLVASIATVRFARVGYFSWRLFWPFALGSVPFAFVGGAITLDTRVYQYVVGVALAYAAVRMWREAADARASAVVSDPPVPVAVACGATIGFLSGATGVGGGVFLSPVVLLARWASPKATAAVSSAFILANSVSGLAGNLTSLASLPNGIGVWLACAGVGGAIGSGLGSTRFASSTVRRMLGVVLALAAAKMLLG